MLKPLRPVKRSFIKKHLVFILFAGLVVLAVQAYNPVYKPGGPQYTVLPSDTLQADSLKWPHSFGFGRPASSLHIADLDIDVSPDGQGLPAGSGNAQAGKAIYNAKCAACHQSVTDPPPGPPLINTGNSKVKTIGNYWPYATTLFDYIRRAMPYNAPGSLTNYEVYSLTAYLLEENRVIKPGTLINRQTLPAVVMPALIRFVPDDRKGGPEVK